MQERETTTILKSLSTQALLPYFPLLLHDALSAAERASKQSSRNKGVDIHNDLIVNVTKAEIKG